MIGDVDVSHLAKLVPGDEQERIIELYGQPREKKRKSWLPGHEEWGYGGAGTIPGFPIGFEGTKVKRVDVFRNELKHIVGQDPLLELIDRTEADAIATLGPPTRRFGEPRRESLQ